MTTWYRCSPQGPWSQQTTIYTAPHAAANGCETGTLVPYNAKAHMEFTDADGVLMAYNVNAIPGSDLVCADGYKPRFVRVQIPGVTEAELDR